MAIIEGLASGAVDAAACGRPVNLGNSFD